MLSLWLGILKILVVLLLKYLFFFFFFFFLISIWVEIFTKKKKLYDQDLHKYIKNSTEDLSSEIILKFAKEIASGMSTIHSTGIVHRDLKTFSFFFFFFFFFFLVFVFLFLFFFFFFFFSFLPLFNNWKQSKNQIKYFIRN